MLNEFVCQSSMFFLQFLRFFVILIPSPRQPYLSNFQLSEYICELSKSIYVVSMSMSGNYYINPSMCYFGYIVDNFFHGPNVSLCMDATVYQDVIVGVYAFP